MMSMVVNPALKQPLVTPGTASAPSQVGCRAAPCDVAKLAVAAFMARLWGTKSLKHDESRQRSMSLLCTGHGSDGDARLKLTN